MRDLMKSFRSFNNSINKRFLKPIIILNLTLYISGCIGNPPVPCADGSIIGGDTKLNAILVVINKLHEANSKQNKEMFYAWYSAVICSEPNQIPFYEGIHGILPKRDDIIEADYQIYYSDTFKEKANLAIITEVIDKKLKETKIQCRTLIFSWNGSEWIKLDKEVFELHFYGIKQK